ncbi:hypothetical protein [Mycoplasma sp. P36-A1]|uniref:hypothetical protein n=1 Tax=Mycoplasma sp. P36-A1 TaxID=3252900 RepID=UPI003C2EF896
MKTIKYLILLLICVLAYGQNDVKALSGVIEENVQQTLEETKTNSNGEVSVSTTIAKKLIELQPSSTKNILAWLKV